MMEVVLKTTTAEVTVVPTVTFLLGYCGSGKSYLAERMAREQGVRVFDEGFLGDPCQHEELIKALLSGQDCVVVEIHYCIESYRQAIVAEVQAAVAGIRIKWICFEKDLKTANANCWRRQPPRNPKDHEWINAQLQPKYTFPPDAVVLPITLAPNPVEALEETA